MNNLDSWEEFMSVMDDSLYDLLDSAYHNNFEYDPWDHGNGIFQIQLWLPHYCGSIVFTSSDQKAYFDTSIFTGTDVLTTEAQVLLQTEVDRLNNSLKYTFSLVKEKTLCLEYLVDIPSDAKGSSEVVFNTLLEISRWVEQWNANSLLPQKIK